MKGSAVLALDDAETIGIDTPRLHEKEDLAGTFLGLMRSALARIGLNYPELAFRIVLKHTFSVDS